MFQLESLWNFPRTQLGIHSLNCSLMTKRALFVIIAVFVSAHCSAVSRPSGNKTPDDAVPNLHQRTQIQDDGKRVVRGLDDAMGGLNEERTGPRLRPDSHLFQHINMFSVAKNVPTEEEIASVVSWISRMGVDIQEVYKNMNDLRASRETYGVNEDTLYYMALGREYFKQWPPVKLDMDESIDENQLNKLIMEYYPGNRFVVSKPFLTAFGVDRARFYAKMKVLINRIDCCGFDLDKIAYMAAGSELSPENIASSSHRVRIPSETVSDRKFRLKKEIEDLGLDFSKLEGKLELLMQDPKFSGLNDKELLRKLIHVVIADELS